MAWRPRPCWCGDPELWSGVLRFGTRPDYGPGFEPVLRCDLLVETFFDSTCAVCRVACLEWVLRIGELRAPRPGQGATQYPLEIFPAKEAKETFRFAMENI